MITATIMGQKKRPLENNSIVTSFPKNIRSVLQSARLNDFDSSYKKQGRILVVGKKNRVSQLFKTKPYPWQLKKIAPLMRLDTPEGPHWIINLWLSSPSQGINSTSDYSMARDRVGYAYSQALCEECDAVEVSFVEVSPEAILGGLVGVEMGSYNYKKFSCSIPLCLNQFGGKITQQQITQAFSLGVAVNITRHLVNIPPSHLNPKVYESVVRSLFDKKAARVGVWREDRLKKEGMGLLLGVGQGASHKARMIHIKYRPPGVKTSPIAFVGKGITFDTGGLDLKTASGMRLMKKDMGGSAAVVGLAYWACESKIKRNLDFYLAIAENSVSKNSIRPSDVLTGRSGMTVEVHNTDAEGRLALADVLDVATTRRQRPSYVVDIATLTGAIKAALGKGVGGVFGNNQKLVDSIYNCSLASGDPMWPMPLIHSYRTQLTTPFADIQNCTDGFGGAVTAALFLESFVRKIPWAHLDIYAWNDSPKGALQEVGGSGQAVQCLAHWLQCL